MSVIFLFTGLNQPACFHREFVFRLLLEMYGADSTAQSTCNFVWDGFMNKIEWGGVIKQK